jgi:hypothetical protein
MWQIDAIDRLTGATVVDGYAGFESYAEARAWADSHEMEARGCGWTWVIVQQ